MNASKKKELSTSNLYISRSMESLRKEASLSKLELTEAGFLETYRNGYLKGYSDALSGQSSIFRREN